MQAFDFGRPELCQFPSYLKSFWKRSPIGPVRLKLLDRRPGTGGSTDQIEVYLGLARVNCASAENFHELKDATCGFVALQRYSREIVDFQGPVSPKECLRLNCDAGW